MGKYDGILICTDLDHTLLADDKSISEENKEAIEYFMSEGGYFTFATGRSRQGIEFILNRIKPNAPIVLFNGAAIYDLAHDKIIWETFLDENASKVFELIEKNCPFAGIEVCGKYNIYISRGNDIIHKQLAFEGLPENYRHYSAVTEPLRKALFLQEADLLHLVREEIASSPYSDSYNFMQSDPCYYEILPKDASKGAALLKIADILGIKHKNTIGVGDNENDCTLIKNAGIGVAVSNAIPQLLDIADFITTDNNTHALSTIICSLDKKIINI